MQEHEGHRLRLRERFESSGLDSFAQHEALELLLTYAIPRKDTKPIAKALIGRFGSVGGVLCAPYEELRCVPGIGGSAADGWATGKVAGGDTGTAECRAGVQPETQCALL